MLQNKNIVEIIRSYLLNVTMGFIYKYSLQRKYPQVFSSDLHRYGFS